MTITLNFERNLTGVIGLPVNNQNGIIGTVSDYDPVTGVATITLNADISLPDSPIGISSRKQIRKQDI